MFQPRQSGVRGLVVVEHRHSLSLCHDSGHHVKIICVSLRQGTDPDHEILWQLLDHNLAQWDVTHMTTADDRTSGGLHDYSWHEFCVSSHVPHGTTDRL